MENLDSKEYRDNLAKEIKSTKKEERGQILDSAKETQEYQEAKTSHLEAITAISEKDEYLQIIKDWKYDNGYHPEEIIKQIPESLLSNKSFVKDALYYAASKPLFDILPESMRKDRDVINAAISRGGISLEDIPKDSDIWNDKDFLLSFSKKIDRSLKDGSYGDIIFDVPQVYKFASEEIKNDKDFILAMISSRAGINPAQIPETLTQDPEIASAIFKKYETLAFATPEMRADKKLARIALARNPSEFQYLADELKQDYSFYLEIKDVGGQGTGWKDKTTYKFMEASEEVGISRDVNKKISTRYGERVAITDIKNLDLLARYISELNGDIIRANRHGSISDREGAVRDAELIEVLGKEGFNRYEGAFGRYSDLNDEERKKLAEFQQNRQIDHLVELITDDAEKERVKRELAELVKKYKETLPQDKKTTYEQDKKIESPHFDEKLTQLLNVRRIAPEIYEGFKREIQMWSEGGGNQYTRNRVYKDWTDDMLSRLLHKLDEMEKLGH